MVTKAFPGPNGPSVCDTFRTSRRLLKHVLCNWIASNDCPRRLVPRSLSRRLRFEFLEDRCLLAAGDLDLSFGVGGKVRTTFGSFPEFSHAVALQADGKIVLAGYASNGSKNQFAVSRYNADGSLDMSFDGDGKVTTDFGGLDEFGFGVEVQADGKIVVAGTVFRGGTKHEIAVARFNPNGSLDNSFDGDGRLTTAIGTVSEWGLNVAVQPDGRILVSGQSYNGSNDNVSLVRYNTNGSLDSSFDGDGKVTTPIGTSRSVGRSVVVQEDGKIVVAGQSYNGSNYDFAIALQREWFP